LLLHMGCPVVSSERHPLVGLMLLRAYEVWENPLKAHWQLLLRGERPLAWDVTYFDPMFNEPSGVALSRKEMRIFRSVVGEDKDAEKVAQELRGLGKRLIVKRPLKGEALLPGPDFTQEGKAMRFDVYLPKPVAT
jgi:16S rRNA (guanine1516-N2)-methyltransferase